MFMLLVRVFSFELGQQLALQSEPGFPEVQVF
jgi:hypothetical protein